LRWMQTKVGVFFVGHGPAVVDNRSTGKMIHSRTPENKIALPINPDIFGLNSND
jgi:hypothetical protein